MHVHVYCMCDADHLYCSNVAMLCVGAVCGAREEREGKAVEEQGASGWRSIRRRRRRGGEAAGPSLAGDER